MNTLPPFNIPVDTKKNPHKDSLSLGCESREKFKYTDYVTIQKHAAGA